MSELYLVRHAAAARPGVLAGRSDIPLLPEGEAQAARLRDELGAVVFAVAWSSPLRRARRTAEIILSGNTRNAREPVIVAELTEIALGLWEGLHKEEVRRGWPDVWERRGRDFLNVPPPMGESVAALAGRVRPAFAAVLAQARRYDRSLLVAHQAVNRVILADCLGLSLARMMEIEQPPAAVTVLELGPGGVRRVQREAQALSRSGTIAAGDLPSDGG